MCLLVLHIIFWTRKYKNRPLKSIPVFRPGLYSEIMSSLLRLAPPPKNKQIPQDAFRVRSYSLGIETINTLTLYPFIDSLPPLKTIPREPYPIPDQNGQSVYLFSETYMVYVRENRRVYNNKLYNGIRFLFRPTKIVLLTAPNLWR